MAKEKYLIKYFFFCNKNNLHRQWGAFLKHSPFVFSVLSSLNVTWFLRDSLLSLSLQEEKTKRKGEKQQKKTKMWQCCFSLWFFNHQENKKIVTRNRTQREEEKGEGGVVWILFSCRVIRTSVNVIYSLIGVFWRFLFIFSFLFPFFLFFLSLSIFSFFSISRDKTTRTATCWYPKMIHFHPSLW